MKVLSLFSGGGLGDYGLELAGMEIVGQVEIDDYCQKILQLRWPNVPKWKDIKEFKGSEVQADLISGGFPCQPFSVAGKQRGKDDNRYLWPEMLRVISEVKPTWVLGENVSGIVKFALDQVLSDLEGEGYTCQTFVIPACAVDAPHRRDRVWIIANSKHNAKRPKFVTSSGKWKNKSPEQNAKPIKSLKTVADSDRITSKRIFKEQRKKNQEKRKVPSGLGETLADSRSRRHGLSAEKIRSKRDSPELESRWASEPNVGRVANGVPARVDRLKLLGNGQVVQVVEWIGKKIMEFELKK